jgi:hypothetical protein
MLPPRDAELVAMARSYPEPLWTAAELFGGRPVPHWALGALSRLQDCGYVLRQPVGTCRWKYRLTEAALNGDPPANTPKAA